MEEVFERRRSSATLSTPCNNHCSAQNLLRATTGDFYLYSEDCRSLGRTVLFCHHRQPKSALLRLTCVSQEPLNQGQLVLCPLNVWIDGFDILRRSQTRHIFQRCPRCSSTASRVPHNYFTAITTSVKARSVSKGEKKVGGRFSFIIPKDQNIISTWNLISHLLRRPGCWEYGRQMSRASAGWMCTRLIRARALASAGVWRARRLARVFRSNRWRSRITRLLQSTTCYSRVSQRLAGFSQRDWGGWGGQGYNSYRL